VLPFADLSPDRDQGYFCEGVAEEVINALVALGRLHVAPRTATFQVGAGTPGPILGERLGVTAVLEGSVRKDGERLRITVRLTTVADGYCRWSERYDRQLQDVFAIQEEIAANTVRALQGALDEDDWQPVPAAPVDVEAYDYYLRGRRFFYRQSKRDHEFARQLFQRAIEADPAFARAYAGLADCCLLLYKHFDRRRTYLQQAGDASLKAVELAPDLGEAHATRGLYYSLSGASREAVDEFEAALRLSPGRYEVYYLYGMHLLYLTGDLAGAAEQFGRAAAAQPGDYQAPLLQAACYRGRGMEESALQAYRHGLMLARRHLDLNPDDVRAIYLAANAMVALGERTEGLEWAARSLALTPTPSSVALYNVAAIYSLAGEPERALDYLERAVAVGYRQREPFEHDPDLRPLRGHPRFNALLRSALLNREALPDDSPVDQLTAREREVLDLVARGLANEDIARRLHIGAKTVRNHVTHVFAKLGVARRAEAIVKAREAGLGTDAA
jgi:non-specific serine/threonine protein kinase